MIPDTVLRSKQFSVLKVLVWFSAFILLSNVKPMMHSLINLKQFQALLITCWNIFPEKNNIYLLKKGSFVSRYNIK